MRLYRDKNRKDWMFLTDNQDLLVATITLSQDLEKISATSLHRIKGDPIKTLNNFFTGKYYFSETHGAVLISSMHDNHLINAIKKHYADPNSDKYELCDLLMEANERGIKIEKSRTNTNRKSRKSN